MGLLLRAEGALVSPTHNSAGALKVFQPHTCTPVFDTGCFPATIQTNDNPSPVKSASPAGGSRAHVEKEGATFAARTVSSKLQMMQLAEKESCRKRNEQKMAERLAHKYTKNQLNWYSGYVSLHYGLFTGGSRFFLG